MSKLEIAKKIIEKYCRYAYCGLFNSRNICGDIMSTIYCANGLTIDICYDYGYFEVFGLDEDEFDKLYVYYSLIKDN